MTRAPLSLVVVGNCQAESLRLLLDAEDVVSQRLPAVHELTTADVVPLLELVAHADLLVMQPVVDDYRGLPVGTSQLVAHLPPGARTALVPPVRYAGLHPYHLLVHPPGLERPDPPVVPYHDVRTVLRAADLPPLGPLTPQAVRAVAAASVAELERREHLHGTVRVSDLLTRPVADSMRTINHPGNTVLEPLAARVRAALGLVPHAPGVRRPLLTSIHAPVEPVVVETLGLGGGARGCWVVDGREVSLEEVEAAHLAWYADRPEMLAAAVERVGGVVSLLRGV